MFVGPGEKVEDESVSADFLPGEQFHSQLVPVEVKAGVGVRDSQRDLTESRGKSKRQVGRWRPSTANARDKEKENLQSKVLLAN